jgi:hypothetical protein
MIGEFIQSHRDVTIDGQVAAFPARLYPADCLVAGCDSHAPHCRMRLIPSPFKKGVRGYGPVDADSQVEGAIEKGAHLFRMAARWVVLGDEAKGLG